MTNGLLITILPVAVIALLLLAFIRRIKLLAITVLLVAVGLLVYYVGFQHINPLTAIKYYKTDAIYAAQLTKYTAKVASEVTKESQLVSGGLGNQQNVGGAKEMNADLHKDYAEVKALDHSPVADPLARNYTEILGKVVEQSDEIEGIILGTSNGNPVESVKSMTSALSQLKDLPVSSLLK